MRKARWLVSVFLAVIVVGCGTGTQNFDPKKSIQAIPPGPYSVGSSNLEANVPSEQMVSYLNGARIGGKQRYLSELLKNPASALQFDAVLPTAPASVFGVFEGKPLPIVLYAFYPTVRDNVRPDYKFPYADTEDNVLPHMQSATEGPIFSADQEKYPLIVYSPGYEAHCLWDVDHMKVLASHGYIVACIFYGDGRGDWAGNIGMRPVVLKQAMDYFLAHPDYRDAIDTNRIGISGASFGGYTVLTALGGQRVSGLPAMPDDRVKAGFATVPALDSKDYFVRNGLRAIQKPFLAVYAGNDKIVRKEDVESRIKELQGPTASVRFDNEAHVLSRAAWPLVHTWEVLFFNTWLKGDRAAGQTLYSAGSVAGEAVNQKIWQSGVPE